jgi:hypothetical protein
LVLLRKSNHKEETMKPKWILTNGDPRLDMDVCTVCAQPYRSGHIDCSCPTNHPEKCDRPNYNDLLEDNRKLRAALLAMQEAFSLANDYENDIPTAAANRVTARKLTREALQDTSEQETE